MINRIIAVIGALCLGAFMAMLMFAAYAIHPGFGVLVTFLVGAMTCAAILGIREDNSSD